MEVTDESLSKYDMTIGIECHVQLATNSKLFSASNNDARDTAPNMNVSPIDYGLPGMLPMLNKKAIELAVKAGKALNAPIAEISRFDRKHYFYPDLPKGYQTTQMYYPIILAGHIDVPLDDDSIVPVRIHHAHLEEDAGKLTHHADYSLVDLNRAGTPLIEIVSEPDIHSPEAARAYATELRRLMTFAGVTRGDLYHGNMRFDVNLSVALKSAPKLGTRAEVKNLNSFRSVERAAIYEFRRQVAELEAGRTITQETRGWDDVKLKTYSQRSKEDAQDYRYMPDADIPPVILTKSRIDEIQSNVPMLPPAYRDAWKPLALDRSVTESLLSQREYAELVESIRHRADNKAATRVAHWLVSARSSDDEADSAALSDVNTDPSDYLELAAMVEAQEISSTGAKEIFNEIVIATSSQSPRQIAEARKLLQVSDVSAIVAIVDEVLADPASARAIEDIRGGNDKAIGFLVGSVMKKSKGTANPGLAQTLIRERM